MPWRELNTAQWSKLLRFGRYLRRFRRLWIILRDVEADIAAIAARRGKTTCTHN